ncbi:MAG: GNAT family N-acetyltransferase [Anaerolineae bacterium]
MNGDVVFETERLVVRKATTADADFYHRLWTHPQVMRYVGFSQGLPITREELKERLASEPPSAFDRLLVVEKKESGEPIGECMVATPDEAGIVEPDIKLLPEHQGRGYGRELWRALIAYQFEHTDGKAVQTTPNVDNVAAIRLYESVGATRVAEGVFRFPAEMQAYTTPVPHYVYRLYRADWDRLNSKEGTE